MERRVGPRDDADDAARRAGRPCDLAGRHALGAVPLGRAGVRRRHSPRRLRDAGRLPWLGPPAARRRARGFRVAERCFFFDVLAACRRRTAEDAVSMVEDS